MRASTTSILTGAAFTGRALLAAAVAAGLVMLAVVGMAKDHHLSSELESHGVAASATVTHVRHSAGSHGPIYVSDVVVSFTAAGRPASGHLSGLGRGASAIRDGDVVNVVYLAGRPDQVMLADALHHSHLGAELVFAVMTIGSIAFVIKVRKRKSHDRPSFALSTP